MDSFMQLMDEDYKQQHYPSGYFSALVKGNQSLTAVYVISAVFLLISLLLFFLGIRGIIWDNSNLIGGLVFIGFGVLLVLFDVFIISVGKKQKGKNRQDWVQEFAKKSSYSKNEVEEFDRQLVAEDAYLLTLNGKFNQMEESIITADFIKSSSFIFKQSDLKAVCLFNLEEPIGAGSKIKYTKKLQVGLITDRSRIWLDADENRGRAFIAMLKEKFPAIETKDSAILKDKEFDSLMKKYIKPNRD